VDRSTTGEISRRLPGNWVEKSAAQAIVADPVHEKNHTAKVRLAGSNPVVRSKNAGPGSFDANHHCAHGMCSIATRSDQNLEAQYGLGALKRCASHPTRQRPRERDSSGFGGFAASRRQLSCEIDCVSHQPGYVKR
jgi:hypothetical protein